MKLRKVIFYPGISVANLLIGYVSRLYLMTAFCSLIYYIDSKKGIPQWCFHLGGILMLLVWLALFLLVNYIMCSLANKKNTLQLYITQLFIAVAGFILAFIV